MLLHSKSTKSSKKARSPWDICQFTDVDIDGLEDQNLHDNDLASHSGLTSTHNAPTIADTSSSSKKTSGHWSDHEITQLLDYVKANCTLNTLRSLNLKKSDFNKACNKVKLKDPSKCHYKWGHVCYITDDVYTSTDLFQFFDNKQLCSIYKAVSLWDKKSGSRWHDDYGVNTWTVAEK